MTWDYGVQRLSKQHLHTFFPNFQQDIQKYQISGAMSIIPVASRGLFSLQVLLIPTAPPFLAVVMVASLQTSLLLGGEWRKSVIGNLAAENHLVQGRLETEVTFIISWEPKGPDPPNATFRPRNSQPY